jgi:D-arabinitol 4-dehydrogenase
LSFPDLAADVEAAKQRLPGGTIYAALTAILRERMRRSGGKVTLLNCDNLRHNGDRFRGDAAVHLAVGRPAAARLGDGEHQQS